MRSPKFLGVYSRKSKDRQGKYPAYFAWRLPDGNYAVQELDQAFTARGQARAVAAPQFDALFKLDPANLAAPITTPDFRLMRPAPQPRLERDFDALELARKARQIEADLRGSFDKALRALGRPRDRKGALASLAHIAGTKKGIVPEHKHMFRDFGVALRKKSLPELALECASRAVELAPEDDHARFNMARLLCILGRYDDADAQLRIAAGLDPNEPVYGRLKRHLERERQFSAAKGKLE